VRHDSYADTPRDSADGVVAARAAGEQRTHSVGDRGERLVLDWRRPLLINIRRNTIIGVLLTIGVVSNRWQRVIGSSATNVARRLGLSRPLDRTFPPARPDFPGPLGRTFAPARLMLYRLQLDGLS
jgi:hypothetical protein